MTLPATTPAFPAIARTSFRLCASFSLTFLLAYPALGQSLADPSVKLGAATISGLGTGNVRITQSSDKAVIDWRAFSVDSGSTVVFAQPSAHAIALNRVTGTAETRIDGNLLANGQVWLLNPNGVLIGGGGRIGTAGFLATTHALSDDDFAAGRYAFDANGSSAGVVNFGQIVSDEGGYAVLAGTKVGNAGIVQARLGQVALGAGKSFVLDMAGDKLLSFAVTQPLNVVPAGGALVENIGVLSAAGGQVLLTAKSAADVVGGVINTSGVIDATSVYMKAGKIVLDGGDLGTVAVSGLLDASGKSAGQTGGAIGVFGDTVVVGGGARLDASGDAGGGAIRVGGGWQGATIDGHASSVRAGVASTATLDASALGTGNGGEIVLWSDVNNARSMTIANGSFYARGGTNGGNGGRIETSGRYLVTDGVRGSAAATIGTAGLWLFDPYNVEIVAAGGPNIVNPGFENGTTGWTSLNGGTALVTTSYSVPNGTLTSQVSSGGNFAVVSAGNQNVQVGIQQSFSATAGQSFSLYANFVSREGCCSFNDQGGVTLIAPNLQSTTLYVRSVASVGGQGAAGWDIQTVNLSQTGTYILQAYAVNVGDSAVPSNLAFELAANSGSQSANGAFSNISGTQTWTPNNTPSKIDVNQITGFLNAGTNVQITTGTAGTGNEAGNITVNAAIAKTAGASASLQLDALGGIAVNQAISSSSNNLNVTLNAGSGGIALGAGINTNGGALTLNTTGTATQTAAFTTNTLVLNGSGGTHTLGVSTNSFNTVAANTGTVTLANNLSTTRLGTVTTSGALSVAAVGDLLLDSTVTIGGISQLKAASKVQVNNGASVVAAADVALIAGTNFVNQAGSSAITTSNGARWLVYSQAPATDTFGSLASGNLAIWGKTATTAAPASVASGNRYVFSTSPTFTVTATNASKVYGDVLDGMSTRPYSVSGIVNAATYSNVFSQDVLTGTPSFTSAGDAARATVAGGPYAITVGQGSLSLAGYSFSYVGGQLTVTRKALTASLTGSVAKVYDGTTGATLASGNYMLPGVVSGDAVALNNSATGSYDTKNVGSSKTVSVSGLTLTGADAGNYTVNASANAAIGSITAKSVTASLTGTVTKIYDGTAAATLAGSNYTVAGLVSGDAVTLNNPVTGTYDTKNVGLSKTITASGLMLSGSDAGNYTVNASASAAIGRIDAKSLSATLTGSVVKTYDGTTAATLGAANYSLTGTIMGDAVALNNPVSGTYDNRNAGTGKTVSTSGIALTGTDAGNYTVNASASAAIGRIDVKAITAALTGSVVKIYDGGTAATLGAANYTLTGAVANDAVGLNNPVTGAYDTRNVGTAKLVSISGIALTGADAGNYSVNASASAAIGRIDAKSLSATLTGSVVKTYDGTTAATLGAANYSLTGTVMGDAVALNNPVSGTYDNRNAGTGKTVSTSGIALTGTDAGNYTVNASASAAIGRIDVKAITAALTGSVVKIYDGGTAAALGAANYTLTGAVANDAVGLNNPVTGAYDTRNVGTAKLVSISGIALTGADAGNYSVNASASAAIGRIDAKSLSATLTGSVVKTYDGTTAATLGAANYSLTGTIMGDAVALNNPVSGTYDNRNAGTGKTVSTSGIALTGTDAGNYTVNASASAAIGQIDKKALAASLTGSVVKTYDGTTAATLAAGNYALSGKIGTEDVVLNNPASASYDTKNVGTAKTVTVGGFALSGVDASNYTVNTGASAAIGQIDKLSVVAALTGTVTKVYDGNTTATLGAANYKLTGALANDAVALNSPAAGAYDNRNAGTAKTVSVGGIALTGADAGNYTVNASASAAVGRIDVKAITAALTGSVVKIYDGGTAATLGAANYTLTGVVANDAVGFNNSVTGAYDTRNVGTAKLVSISGIALTGADAGNYSVNASASAAIGRIDTKSLSAALIGTVAKTYDSTTAATLGAANYSLTGSVAGDAVTLNNPVSGTYDSRNAGAGKTVSISGIALTGADAGNYTVNASTSAAVGRIDPKSVSAALIGSVAKTYDGTTVATLGAANYALTGILSGDAVALNTLAVGSYDNRNAGSAKTVSAAGIGLTGADAGNYAVNASASAAIGQIDPKAIMASLTGTVTKSYDGGTTATLTGANYQFSGLVANDAVALKTPATATYDTRNVGVNKLVSVGGIALAGVDAGNYTVNTSASAAVGQIDAKALAATLIGSVVKTYDGGTAAALGVGNYALGGAVAGDQVALQGPAVGSYADRNAGTAKIVSAAGIGLTGADAGNYTVNASASGAIGRIDPKSVSAALIGTVVKTYDGTATATFSAANYTLTGTVSGDAVAINTLVSGSYDNRNAGTAKTVSVGGIALTGADAGNYAVNASASAAIGRIDPKAVTAALAGIVAKTYDGSAAATLGAANYALAGTVSGDAVALNTPGSGSYDNRNAGSAKTVSVGGIGLTGADAGNYTVNAQASAAVGRIDPKTVAAALTGAATKVYDGTTAATLGAANYTLSGTIAGDAVALNTPAAATYDTRNAGTAKTVSVGGIALTGADAGNYAVNAQASAAIGRIDVKAVTASLTGSVIKIYDGTTVATFGAGNYLLSGTVAGDAVALNNPVTGSYDNRNVGTAKLVSIGGIALTGADAGNYSVNAQASAAIGRIDAKALSAALTGVVSRIFNGSTSATLAPDNFALTGFVSGESATITQTLGQYASSTAGVGINVSTTLSQAQFNPADGTSLSNYTLPIGALSGLIGTITPAVVVPLPPPLAVVVPPPPPPPPAPNAAPPAGDAAPPPVARAVTSSPAPAPEAPPPPPPTNGNAGGGGEAPPPPPAGAPVEASPPSPVAAEKPPTPKDAADSGDPILASVDSGSDETPAPNATRQNSESTPIAGGLLSSQRPLPPPSSDVPGLDQGFSGSGNIL